jgi:hypothetical protein
MAAVLVTLTQAKAHLRITTSADDVDIQLKLDQAEGIIRDYLKDPDAAWVSPATAPAPVTAAILLMTTHLYEHRGDDMAGSLNSGQPDTQVWEAIGRLLMRLRDPALA